MIDHTQRADTGRRQIQTGGRAQAAGADYQYAGGFELLLTGAANLWQQQVTTVAGTFRSGEHVSRH